MSMGVRMNSNTIERQLNNICVFNGKSCTIADINTINLTKFIIIKDILKGWFRQLDV